ncbi:MAG: methionyl-tRNA formyltransferase [Defluviitaleaceae bacterium]|nr:methionyl-tRNA formyltransferase [Defluviitaleaceae bacterium]
MRIVFMGTPEFALVCLKALTASHHHVAAVITQPDRSSGRGKKLVFSPVKEFALTADMPLLQPEKIKTAAAITQLEELSADIFVVAAYGQILSERILNMPKYGAINVHASLLPKYRGASPIQQAIVEGEAVTGITIMQMDKGLDTGNMLLKREVPITHHDTGGTLHDKLCDAAPAALLEALELIENGQVTATPQDNNLATYAPLITKDMTRIDWHKSPTQIVNLIRAYNPFPAAFTVLGDHSVKIWQAEVANITHSTNPGKIIKTCPKDGIFVAAKNGAVRIAELTPSGGKKMTAADYIKGRSIT